MNNNIHPVEASRIKEVQSLDPLDRLSVYMHYYITQIEMKHDFEVFDTSKKDWRVGLPSPDKEFNQIAFYYMWKDNHIKTFDEFFSEKNIDIRDHGEDWQKKGFAQRHQVQCFGAYDWFWKFQGEFNLA